MIRGRRIFAVAVMIAFSLCGPSTKADSDEAGSASPTSSKLPAAFCRFHCDQVSYSNAARTQQLAELTEIALADLQVVRWVDRSQIEAALNEAELSAWNPSSAVAALRLGRIVSASIAVVGRTHLDPAHAWQLELEIIDVRRADVLESTTLPLSRSVRQVENETAAMRTSVPVAAKVPVSEQHARQAAQWVTKQMPRAIQRLHQRQNLASIAVLHFDNRSDSSRLDYFERDLIDGFSRWEVGHDGPSDNNSAVHVLTFPATADAAAESELLADGLAYLERNEDRPIDHFVWGHYREIDSAEVSFPDVPIELNLVIWDGASTPKTIQIRRPTRQQSKLVEDAIAAVNKLDLKPSTKPIDPVSSTGLADDLLARAIELNRITHLNDRVEQVDRLQRQKLRFLGAAACIDPTNKAVHRERILQSYFRSHRWSFDDVKEQDDRFLVRLNELKDWKKFADRFGNEVRFDYSHLGYRNYSIHNQRLVAVEPWLVEELICALGDDARSWVLKAPDDVPESQIKRWQSELNEISVLVPKKEPETDKRNADVAADETKSPTKTREKRPRKPRKPFVPIAPFVEVPLRSIELPRFPEMFDKAIQSIFVARESIWVQTGGSVHYGSSAVLLRIDLRDPDRAVTKITGQHDALGAVMDVDPTDPNRGLWIASPGFGIESLDPTTGTTADLFAPRDGLPTQTITGFAKTGRRVYCIGGERREGAMGYFDLDSETWSEIELPMGSSGERNPVTQIAVTDSKIVALGGNGWKLIARDVAGSGEWLDLTQRILDEHPEFSFAQRTRLEVQDFAIVGSLLCVASNKGLIGYDLNTNQVSFAVPTKFQISAMHAASDCLWVGGHGSRLIRFNLSSRRFDHRVKIPRRYAGHPLSICADETRVWYAVQARDYQVLEIQVDGLAD